MRQLIAATVLAATLFATTLAAGAAETRASGNDVLRTWYGLMLELVRHTATYSPPVGSRAYAYVGITAFEAVASGEGRLQSLAGQLNGLTPGPEREAGAAYDDAVVLEAALSDAVHAFFSNTGPTGQRVMERMTEQLGARVSAGVAGDVAARSVAYGEAIAAHILQWAQGDGGATIVNMGFPLEYKLSTEPGHWAPTSTIVQQQAPLLPDWGKNRPFAMPVGTHCALPPPLAYSEDAASPFYAQAMEVYTTGKGLSPEQTAIARFWSDDAMLTVTPPGHWISIAMQIIARDDYDLEKSVDMLARLGIAQADAFIGCWREKFEYDLIRPVTYIRAHIDPNWNTLLTTPPFPEYPSGHSTQSAAAATLLTGILGPSFAFSDDTGEADGLPARTFSSFWAAADEAGISRMYGGIHFRAAIENGLDQGRCIGAFALALRTWK